MKDVLRTILQEWKERALPQPLPREADLGKYASIKLKKIVVITGFRRVGKTYMMFGLINELLKERPRGEVVYINFEDERIPLRKEFLTQLLPASIEAFGRKMSFIFLDEVQEMPLWSKWLRRIYDTESARIFVSGSSSKVSSREIPTELRGRSIEVRVFPLSFSEFLKFKNITVDKELTAEKTAFVLQLLNEYIGFGGLPEVVLSDEAARIEIVKSYYQTVIRKDIIERHGISNEEALKALLQLLLNSSQYSISKLFATLKSIGFKVGKSTVQRYLTYIENSYFMFSVQIFSHKIKNQIQYPRKVYCIDNAFTRFLAQPSSRGLGRLFENAVAVHLIRKFGESVYYWRSAQKEEVDFVISDGLKVSMLIQACYDVGNLETKNRETRALLKAGRELGCTTLLILTHDYDSEEIVSWFGIRATVRFMPLWKWLLG